MMKKYRTKNIDPVYKIAEEGVENAGRKKDGTKTECVDIAYYLKDRRVIYRSYYVDKEHLAECTEDLLKDPVYRQQRLDAYKIKADRIHNIYLKDAEKTQITLQLDKDQKERLLKTYSQEAAGQDISVLRTESPVGEIFLNYEAEESHSFIEPCYYIYRNYVKTLELLKEYGYDMRTKISPDHVETLYYINENGEEIYIKDKRILNRISYVQKKFLEEGRDKEQSVIIIFKNGNTENYFLTKKK